MIYTYPSNRLEVLAQALACQLSQSNTPVLSPQLILVQHPGMQHWLNMQLATEHQIAMNLAFPLPVRQLWELIRLVLGDQKVPQQSPYAREVLVWRLYPLLADPQITDDPVFAAPTRYWQQQSPHQQALRRYQLAEELADLFEQYLIYRPDWIRAWDQGQFTLPNTAEPHHQTNSDTQRWQAGLWQRLTQAEPLHPVALLDLALKQLPKGPAHPLPDELFIFGINTLAPLWLDFLKTLSSYKQLDIHLFYLNPTNEFWQEAVNDKTAARQRALWLETHDSESGFITDQGNPLVTGLGRQGQTFVRLISDWADIEVEAFAEPTESTLLGSLQADLLRFYDARENPRSVDDHSIHFVSAHNALREVQALHDWLLDQFSQHPDLTPKDIVVMCPKIEDYAPFFEAVFATHWDTETTGTLRLPCSIADRKLDDTDPTLAAFIELLSLPDARFQVSQVMSWLQVPSIAQRFGFTAADLSLIRDWLQAAAIHWGLDADHKQQWITGQRQTAYTWRQGLERLLLGFAWGDEAALVQDQLLLPQVEGQDAQILGRLIDFIRRLEALLNAFKRPRSLSEWQVFLQEQLVDTLLDEPDTPSEVPEVLLSTLRSLGEKAQKAQFDDPLPLAVVRDLLRKEFASPTHTGRQFLVGKITVCSLVPMRAIPFKVVALLGMNDGEFPRVRAPLGFDLMANTAARPGDRSRQEDDRYLFLEALLSARQALYISYQGRDVRTNSERQPSLLVSELMRYLQGATGWRPDAIQPLALQPYDPVNYQGPHPTYDASWLRLTQPLNPRQRLLQLPLPDDLPTQLPLNTLLNAALHPARYFAQQRLGLYLGQEEKSPLSDREPFATTHLDRYQLQHTWIEQRLQSDTPIDRTLLLTTARRSGLLPDHPLIDAELEDWIHQADDFATYVQQRNGHLENQHLEVCLEGLCLSRSVQRSEHQHLLQARLANPKAKDRLTLWLDHLLANSLEPTTSLGIYRGKDDQWLEVQLAAMDQAQAQDQLKAWIQLWRDSLCQPLPWHSELGLQIKHQDFVGKGFEQVWQSNPYASGLDQDPYLQWFWPEPPDPDALLQALEPLYLPLLEALQETPIAQEAKDD